MSQYITSDLEAFKRSMREGGKDFKQALFDALGAGYFEHMKFLIENNFVDINLDVDLKEMLYFLSTISVNIDDDKVIKIVKYIISKSPDILSDEDKEQKIPLHYAFKHSDLMFKLLLRKDPNIAKRNSEDKTFLEKQLTYIFNLDEVGGDNWDLLLKSGVSIKNYPYNFMLLYCYTLNPQLFMNSPCVDFSGLYNLQEDLEEAKNTKYIDLISQTTNLAYFKHKFFHEAWIEAFKENKSILFLDIITDNEHTKEAQKFVERNRAHVREVLDIDESNTLLDTQNANSILLPKLMGPIDVVGLEAARKIVRMDLSLWNSPVKLEKAICKELGNQHYNSVDAEEIALKIKQYVEDHPHTATIACMGFLTVAHFNLAMDIVKSMGPCYIDFEELLIELYYHKSDSKAFTELLNSCINGVFDLDCNPKYLGIGIKEKIYNSVVVEAICKELKGRELYGNYTKQIEEFLQEMPEYLPLQYSISLRKLIGEDASYYEELLAIEDPSKAHKEDLYHVESPHKVLTGVSASGVIFSQL